MKDFDAAYKAEGSYHFESQGFRRWWQMRNYARLCAGARRGHRILDLACGDGRLLEELRRKGLDDLIGVDLSAPGLRLCRSRFPSIPVVRAEMTALPFKKESFDLILISLSLQYVLRERLSEGLRQWHSILRPQGRLIVSYPNLGRCGSLKRTRDDDAVAPGELRETARRCGFEVTQEESISRVVPAWIVRSSTRPYSKWWSWIGFQAANLVPPAIERSYHFVLTLHKRGRQE